MILDKARLGDRETLVMYCCGEPMEYFPLENYKISEHGQSGHRGQAGSVAIFSSISWRHEVCVSCLVQHLNLTNRLATPRMTTPKSLGDFKQFTRRLLMLSS
jgi:hypothetical protein